MASTHSTLPFLPGHTFKGGEQSFARTSTFEQINGYQLPKKLGADEATEMTPEELDAMIATTARLQFGKHTRGVNRVAASTFVPAHVAFDKKVLLFTAYMKSTVHESSVETYRVRYFKIYYYLEDDTISITEPEIENSGMQQGAFLKRQRVPMDASGACYHWTNLNLGMNMTVYGKVLRVTDCNEWTRKFLEKEGLSLNQPEQAPEDPYLVARLPTDKPNNTHQTPSDFDRMKQFLVLDRKVLRFYCVWDDRHNMFGELRSFILHYYLVDDTIEIREVHVNNDGRDPFPILLARQRVPRNYRNVPYEFPTCVMELSEQEQTDLLNPADLAVGKAVHIYGRDFLLYDLDEFTKQFYRQNFGAKDGDFTPVDVKLPAALLPDQPLPPHSGVGSAEDSYLSCIAIAPKPPLGQKSLPMLLQYDNKLLRYQAHLETDIAEDKNRVFIISYRLADDFVSIFEPPKDNSGTTQGKFLEGSKLQRPDSNPDMPTYLAPADFYVGAKLQIFGRIFVIHDADLSVYNFMKEQPQMFNPTGMAAMEAHFGK